MQSKQRLTASGERECVHSTRNGDVLRDEAPKHWCRVHCVCLRCATKGQAPPARRPRIRLLPRTTALVLALDVTGARMSPA